MSRKDANHRDQLGAQKTRWHEPFSWMCGVLGLVLILHLMGCPSDPPKDEKIAPDAGLADQSKPLVTCPKGATCLRQTQANVRSCALILAGSNDNTGISVTFAESILGEHKQQGKRLGLVFIWQKHAAADPKKPLVSLLPKGDANQWKLDKATCYDGNGKPLATPGIAIEKGE